MEKIKSLLNQDQILVEKKTKKGLAETDIRPMIHRMEVEQISPEELRLQGIICAQNPSLNPQYLVQAIEKYFPECAPDFSRAHRVEVLDQQFHVFR